jgi:hypothetical protein
MPFPLVVRSLDRGTHLLEFAQKRDRLERAHQRGYQAGIAGRSKEMWQGGASAVID